jgi:ATP-dependent RNA helicase RhlB
MDITEFDLNPELQRGIAEAGYVSCMPVQEQVLTHAFGGQDLYVQSQTGTGKTAAFLIVIFQRLLTEPLLNGKKAIIMVPTRELAVQVEDEAKILGRYLPFTIGSFYGGVGYGQQEQLLRNNVQVLVGTPGRVLDLNSSGKMNLMDIAFLVLDEADRMFDMGFYPDLRKLIKVVPPADRRQTMLFSATLNAWVKNLAWEYTKNPFEIEIAPETVTVDEVDQALYHVTSADKMRLLLGILEREKPESAIIFCNTKRYTEIIAKRLRVNGYDCEFIIGDLPQIKRLKIIDDLKAGAIRYLVATDVAARGLDIEGLALVVNYDLPVEAENYVHRIGRTARAGKTGKAITLASEQDVYELADIEKYIGKKIPSEIAREDLYAEDKSGGMRIQTDFYEDRPGRDSRDRDGRGRRDRDGRRSGERFREGRGQGREGRFEGPRGPASPGHPRGGPGPGASGDLSHLSFEERMNYYKGKYEGRQLGMPQEAPENSSAGASGNRRRRRRSRSRGREERLPGEGGLPEAASGAPAGDRPSGDQPSGARRSPRAGDGRRREDRPRRDRGEGRDQGSAEGGSAGGRGNARGRGKAGNRPAQPGAQAPAPAEQGARKGILGRILGIFKKK